MQIAVCEGIITSDSATRKAGSREYTRANISYYHPVMKDDIKQKITTWLLEYSPEIKLEKGDKVRVYGTFCNDSHFAEDKMKMIVSEYELLNRKDEKVVNSICRKCSQDDIQGVLFR
jgi:hypothetical protein